MGGLLNLRLYAGKTIRLVNQQVRLLHTRRSRNLNDNTPKVLYPGYLSFYLAGLLEGDGSISIPNSDRNSSGKLIYPSVNFAFALKDIPLANYLCSLIGHGSVIVRFQSESCVYTINSIAGLIAFVNIVNGNLRGGKLVPFNQLINWLNAKRYLSITHNEAMSLPLGNDWWLAGFIDADASFQIRRTMSTLYPRNPWKFHNLSITPMVLLTLTL
ncbi:MAG: LAGLIDADG family homing endonuclease [Sulfolobus sp.]|nr:LAGLIDADG family homing endonuclease [Sulfolobus sp.]